MVSTRGVTLPNYIGDALPFKRIPFLTEQNFMECNCLVLFPVHLVSLNLLTWDDVGTDLIIKRLESWFLLFLRFWWASWLSHFLCASQVGFIFKIPNSPHILGKKHIVGSSIFHALYSLFWVFMLDVHY